MKTPAESQPSFCSIDKGEDSIPVASKASCLLTEPYALARLVPLIDLILVNIV
jgi:hypothetical protein